MVVRGYDVDVMEDWMEAEAARECGCMAPQPGEDGVCARCMLPVREDTTF